MVARLTTRVRAGLALAGLAGSAALLGLPGRGAVVRPVAAAPAPVELPDTLGFDLRYAGVGAEGVDLVWRGAADGPVAARVTLRMEYAGPPGDRDMPLWPVNAWLFFAADDPRGSFAAELSGSMSWRTGELRVTGIVSDGVRAGMPVEQRMRVSRPGLSGRAQVVFLSRLALGGGIGGGIGAESD